MKKEDKIVEALAGEAYELVVDLLRKHDAYEDFDDSLNVSISVGIVLAARLCAATESYARLNGLSNDTDDESCMAFTIAFMKAYIRASKHLDKNKGTLEKMLEELSEQEEH